MGRKIILSVIYVITGISLSLYTYQYAFNNVLATIFELKPITLWQAFALQLVVGIVMTSKEYTDNMSKDSSFSKFEEAVWTHIGKNCFIILIIYLIKDLI